MHMLSKKDLSSDEMETLWSSRNPTTVVTTNGEVRTNEEAQVYVHDLGLRDGAKLDGTPAVLSLGKLCEEHGYTCEWASGQKPRLAEQGKNIFMPNGKLCTSCCPWIVVRSKDSAGTTSSACNTGRDQERTGSKHG